MFPNKPPQGSEGGSAGGASSKTKEKKTGSASTGGVQTGGGNGSGGGSTTTTVDNNTVDTQTPELTDEQLFKMFFESDDGKAFLKRDFKTDAAYARAEKNAYTKWLQSIRPEEEAGAAVEDPTTPVHFPAYDIPPDAPGVSISFVSVPKSVAATKTAEALKMPKHVRQVLKNRGLKVNVANKAKNHTSWPEYLTASNSKTTDTISDGRSIGDLSFYDPDTKDIFVSTDKAGGSANVMVHEMGHAVDYMWLEDNHVEIPVVETSPSGDVIHSTVNVSVISRDDPEWVNLHNNYILPAKGVYDWFDYFVGGPSGDSDSSGRSELFAEGLAAYFQGGLPKLREFLFKGIKDQDTRYHVADTMIAIWTRYQIIK